MEGSELTVLAALGTALATMVYFSWSGRPAEENRNDATTRSKSSGGAGKASTKKGKKRKTGDVPTLIPADDSALDTGLSDAKSTQAPKLVVHKVSHTIPGGLAPVLSEVESVQSTGKKKKKSKKAQGGDKQKSETPTGSMMLAPPVPSPTKASASSSHLHDVSAGSESEWTNVAYTKRRQASTQESASDAGVTTSVTEEEGSVASRKEDTLTSVEKLLPKPQKTAVDDMIDGAKPGIAHVLKVPGPSASDNRNISSQGLGYDIYDDTEDLKGSGIEADEEDSWNIVGHKKRVGTRTPSTYASDTAPSTLATASVAGKGKNAKKNAKKKQAEKEAKDEAERDRQARLAKHNRDLEKAKIDRQYTGKGPSGGSFDIVSNESYLENCRDAGQSGF
ncbi:hypothetical protein FRC17_005218 [Serendipita sp. 399]|nr:hypothetical protein FRC17_005218 [Serendipita sp. 399]